MIIKGIEVKVTYAKGEPKVFQLQQTGEAKKNEKTGHTSKAKFQPKGDNKVLMPYSALYLDTEAK